MATAERRAAETRGRRSELLVAWYLRLKGYRVLARRYRTPVGEIDLIVRRGKQIAFVEVKRRVSHDDGLFAIGAASRKRIARAAHVWLSTHPAAAGHDLRFDVVAIAPRRWPRHIAGAFDGDGNA
jgi:putative endonuclease